MPAPALLLLLLLWLLLLSLLWLLTLLLLVVVLAAAPVALALPTWSAILTPAAGCPESRDLVVLELLFCGGHCGGGDLVRGAQGRVHIVSLLQNVFI